MSQPLSVVTAGQSPSPGLMVAPLPPGSSGVSKAAIALVALGAEHAAEVLKHLPEDQAERLSAEMAHLGAVDERLLDSVCDDLVAETGSVNAIRGGITFTREVLERVVGAERADELIEQFLSGESKPLDFMRSMAAEEIAGLLEGEAPQTTALVVVNLRPALAGRVLDLFEGREQADIAHRLATMGPVEPRVMQDIDRGLREKAEKGVQKRTSEVVSGVEVLAQILQGAGRATERQVLGGLEVVDSELAEAVRALMFTFEDLPKLSDKDLQMVLRDIDAKDLVIALRGVTEELMDRVISNMSQRAGETLREELEMQPPVKRALVEEAQTKVVAAIRVLDEEGSITLPGGEPGEGDDSEVLL